MNDKDAFKKWCEEKFNIAPELVEEFKHTFIHKLRHTEEAWQAACEYKQKELQEELLLYKEAARSEAEFVNELTSVLDLKKETIVEMQNAYETLNAHDEMLIATVDKLKEENKKLVEALKIGVEAGEFFARHADCKRDSWSCKCSFCKDTNSSSNLRKARQVLKELGDK